MSEASIRLRVNNRAVELSVPPAMTLLDLLRERLDLTGAKEGCGKGDCGACTVLLRRSVRGGDQGSAVR
jgi:xanthine dehydrogenase iron-sulfur cluster and FAD-binding subunit A